MKASNNKRRRDNTYPSKTVVKTAIRYRRRWLVLCEVFKKRPKKVKYRGNMKAIPVRTVEETRHIIA